MRTPAPAANIDTVRVRSMLPRRAERSRLRRSAVSEIVLQQVRAGRHVPELYGARPFGNRVGLRT
jgi:hypothetical protein